MYVIVGILIKHHKMVIFIFLFVNNILSAKTHATVDPMFTKSGDGADEMIEPVHFDKDYNIIIRVQIKRGNDNKVIDASTDRVDLMIQAPDYDDTLEAEVCRFMCNLLGVRRKAISVLQKEEEGDTMKKILKVDGKIIGVSMVLDRIISAIDDETFIKKIKEEEEQLSRSLQLQDT